MNARSLVASLSPRRPLMVEDVESVQFVTSFTLIERETVEFLTSASLVDAVAGEFVLVDEFACDSKACAPPPIGTGGSRGGGRTPGAVGAALSKSKAKGYDPHTDATDMRKENADPKFWNGAMVQSALRSGLVPKNLTKPYIAGVKERKAKAASGKTKAVEARKAEAGQEGDSDAGDRVVAHFAGNVRRMYEVIDQFGSKNPIVNRMIEDASLWYPAAGLIGEARGKKYGVSRLASIAVLARLSPGHDWDSNIREHEIVMEVSSRNSKVDAARIAPFLKSIYEGQMKAAKTDVSKSNVKAKMDALDDLMKRVDGKNFNDLSAEDRGKILKAHALVDLPSETFYKEKWEVRSDGTAEPNGYRYTMSGTPMGISFQDEDTWAKVFNILDSDRAINSSNPVVRESYKGEPLDMVISRSLGNEAKVRSFFNNIAFPDGTDDITVDTHATSVVSGHRVAQTSPEYKNISGGLATDGKWYRGAYLAAVEAYREVAEERGVRGRAAQSQTWVMQKGVNDALDGSPKTEALRKVLSDTNLREKMSPEAIKYLQGELAIRDAFLSVIDEAKRNGIVLDTPVSEGDGNEEG